MFLVLGAVFFLQYARTSPTGIPDYAPTLFVLIGSVVYLVSVLLGRVTGRYSPEYSRPFRAQGWTVDVAGDYTGRLPEHLFDISELAGQYRKPLFVATQPERLTDIRCVIGNVMTKVNALEEQGHTERSDPFVSAVITLSDSIDGWVNVRPTPLLEKIVGGDVALESIEFNRLFGVHGSVAKTVFLAMAPNLMAWYQDLQPRPWLHIEENEAALTFPRLLNDDEVSRLPSMLYDFKKLIEHSGVLKR